MKRLLAIFFVLVFLSTRVSADDWPQILGPKRNGVSVETLNWKSKPNELWRIRAGEGFAGPAVVGNRVVIFDRQGSEERVRAVDRRTGKELWSNEFPTYYRGGINPDSGPRCVPVVTGDKIVVFGASGDAHALNLSDGKKIWTRELLKDYKGKEGYFGVGSTPIVVADKVLFNVGGADAGIVALNLADGKTAWKSTNEAASYSSPIQFTDNGRPAVLFVTRLTAVLLDPATGNVITSFPFGKRGPTVNGATPLLTSKSRVLLTSSYGIGACLLDFAGKQPNPIWQNDSSMSSQYNTPLFHNGYLYGIHGREDAGLADLRCVDAGDGKVKWSKSGFGVAHCLLIGDQVLSLTHRGKLVAFDADSESYNETNQASVADSIVRAIPAFSNGVLFFRDEKNVTALQLQ